MHGIGGHVDDDANQPQSQLHDHERLVSRKMEVAGESVAVALLGRRVIDKCGHDSGNHYDNDVVDIDFDDELE